MNKYIFLSFAVPVIGGTQIYLRNKLLYLEKKGWSPIIITEESEGEICVKELLPYKDYIIPELIQSPWLLKKSKRLEVIEKMVRIIGEVDHNTVIETNFIMATLWGELLAERLKVKHFIFLIQEDYSLINVKFMKYFEFKLKRGELAGNTPVAISKLFEGYKEIPKEYDTYLNAYCSNTVEDCKSIHNNCISKADYHIGSIGRINKPFVMPMIDDLIKFAAKHKEKTFQLVMFGGSPNRDEINAIIKKIDSVDNIDVYITGPIFPIPKELLNKIDVFISSAGAAATSANLGHITIVIDANDFEPIGILGYTTNELVHRIPGTPHQQTDELLEDVLFKEKYQRKTELNIIDEKEYYKAFDKHIKYLENSVKTKEYYKVSRVSPGLISRICYNIRVRGKR